MAAYAFTAAGCISKRGWAGSKWSDGEAPEVRGIAAADLDGDGNIEVFATTTNTSQKGAQVFVFSARGKGISPGAAPAPHGRGTTG